MFKKIFFLLFVLIYSSKAESIDLIVFSYNRPMQLYALLESLEKYVLNIENVYVVFKCSDERYFKSYESVKHRFSTHIFLQEDGDRNNFQILTKQCFLSSPNEYLAFAVDDLIIKDFFDCSLCVQLMKETNAYGFYLRLGENITECFMHNDEKTPPPNLIQIKNEVCKFFFEEGSGDWNYPHTLDLTIYKKDSLRKFFLRNKQWNNPNQFEGMLARQRPQIDFGLCFRISKIVNVPVNIVTKYIVDGVIWNNRNLGTYTCENLLEKYEKNFKIDLKPFFQKENIAPHISSDFDFIIR